MGHKITITQDEITPALERLQRADFKKAVKDTVTEMYNRGKTRGKIGSTPFKSGELRISLSADNEEVGYRKEYAPHVEYGHRTRSGGFVKGQRFLRSNVETEAPEYERRLNKILEEAVKK